MTLGITKLMFSRKIFQMFPKGGVRELNQILRVKVK